MNTSEIDNKLLKCHLIFLNDYFLRYAKMLVNPDYQGYIMKNNFYIIMIEINKYFF